MSEQAECAVCALRAHGEPHLANLVKRISLEDYKAQRDPPPEKRSTTFDYSHFDTVICKHCGAPLRLELTVRLDDRARALVQLLLAARIARLEDEEYPE